MRNEFREPNKTIIEVEDPEALETEHRQRTGRYEDAVGTHWRLGGGALTEVLALYGQDTFNLDDEETPRGLYTREDREGILEIKYTGDVDELKDFYSTVLRVRENNLT